MWFASGNRDEDVFADPYDFDVTRRHNDHVAFGKGGPHFCLGNSLARMEIRLMFQELMPRLADHRARGGRHPRAQQLRQRDQDPPGQGHHSLTPPGPHEASHYPDEPVHVHAVRDPDEHHHEEALGADDEGVVAKRRGAASCQTARSARSLGPCARCRSRRRRLRRRGLTGLEPGSAGKGPRRVAPSPGSPAAKGSLRGAGPGGSCVGYWVSQSRSRTCWCSWGRGRRSRASSARCAGCGRLECRPPPDGRA